MLFVFGVAPPPFVAWRARGGQAAKRRRVSSIPAGFADSRLGRPVHPLVTVPWVTTQNDPDVLDSRDKSTGAETLAAMRRLREILT